MAGGPKIGQLMTQLVMTTSPDASLEEAGRLLRECHVSGLPVIDRDEHVVGVVSEKDLVRVLHQAAGIGLPRGLLDVVLGSAPAHGPDALTVCQHRLKNTRVGEVMSRPAVSIGPETTLLEAARIMKVHGVNRLPVVDSDQRLLGIISSCDIRGDLSATALRARGSLHPAPSGARGNLHAHDPFGDA